jgi:dipeptidyl aminopeptidase/acylaminoacyl peptidase
MSRSRALTLPYPSHHSVLLLRLALLLVATSVWALAGGSPVRGQTTDDTGSTIQPWQVALTRSVSEIAYSPDGQHLAYTLMVPRKPIEDDNGPAFHELYVLPPTGEALPFVTGKVDVEDIAWRNDHELAFLDQREGDEHKGLYAISVRGGEARKLVDHESAISAFAFSPNGQSVAFLAKEEKAKERKELEKKGFDQQVYEEDVLFTRLFVADLSALARDAKAEPREVPVKGSVRAVEWSPDGERLMITVTPTPLIDDSYTRIKINVLDLEGDLAAAIDNPGKLDQVSWSPDGKHLAMISAQDLNDPAPGRLMVVPSGGGALRDLLPGVEGHVSAFAWEDDDTLVYAVDLGTETELGHVDLTAGASARTVSPRGDLVVRGVEASPRGGTAAVLAESPRHPAELFTLDLASGATTRRTNSNPWLDTVRLARQETITYKARDGVALEGVLVYPLDYREGQRYPLIMVVHGGPESHFRNGWVTSYSNPGQLGAARGFAVFYPNYRGSTGRGVAFSKASQAAAAKEEFDDLIDALDHLIASGLVDRDKVGITGGSYGGYASAWATTYYSDRFAAAIPFVGISDAISKMGTTDIPQEMYDVHHRKWLWEDWDYFRDASPIFYAKRNRTPTLILHGKDDPRVHPSQSLELYRILELLDQAPVRLVLYPGEGHGNTKAAARFDYMLRTVQWMEHYLKGPGGEPPAIDIDYAAYLPWATEDEDDEDEGEDEDDAAASAGASKR